MTNPLAPPAVDAPRIRAAAAADRDALYDICVRTGASGADASGLFRYPMLLGDVFVGPYLALEPDFTFVAAGPGGPLGYALGTPDSTAFAERCEVAWWPERRRVYADVAADPESRDAWLLRWVESPPDVPAFVDRFPSHLHIDLLPALQGGGWGRRLLEALFAALRRVGSSGVHLGVASDNDRAIGFYRHLGFGEVESDDGTLWMGLPLSR